MIKYDIEKFHELFENKEEVVPGCALFRLDGEIGEIVKSCDSLEEAQDELKKCKASVHFTGVYYDVVEYYIIKNEYDEDGKDVTFSPENMGGCMILEDW